jgi:hypothetical protein
MPKLLHRVPSFVLAGLLLAAPMRAAEAWDHRAMQSHHQAVDRVERPLAPGERRIGRVEIGTATSPSTKVPDTLPRTTQRQWNQRTSFNESPPPASSAPRIQGGRHEGTPGVSHSSPGR